MILLLDDLDRKLKKSESAAKRQRRAYWKLRNAVIDFLGGKCAECGTTDISVLEIHHMTPHLNGGYKHFSGGEIMREWRKILAGEIEAKLFCREHHLHEGHSGNTCTLKKEKRNV